MVPTGHCPCELGEQESSTRQCLPQPVREVLQTLSTLYPSTCLRRGLCLGTVLAAKPLTARLCLPLGSREVWYGQSQSRDPSQSLLQDHGCQAMAVWHFSVVLWKKRGTGGNATGTPGLEVAMSQLGYSSTNSTCARKYSVSNCERQHKITDFQSDSASFISSPFSFSGFVWLP